MFRPKLGTWGRGPGNLIPVTREQKETNLKTPHFFGIISAPTQWYVFKRYLDLGEEAKSPTLVNGIDSIKQQSQ